MRSMITALCFLPATLFAQRLSNARVAAARTLVDTVAPRIETAGGKSPAGAALMSLVIPGVGSFYAGNGHHGRTHLAVAGVSFVTFVAGVGMSLSECPLLSDTPCNSGGGDAVAAIGFFGYLINDVWSAFTAAHDANVANRSATP